jgi:hypothetical protein
MMMVLGFLLIGLGVGGLAYLAWAHAEYLDDTWRF